MKILKTIILLIILLVNIRLGAQPAGGVLSSNTLICSGINSGSITLSGYSGTILRWEYSTGLNGPWTPIFFTNPVYAYNNLTQSLYFRVIVALSGYPDATSSTIYIKCAAQSVSGVINTNSLVCQGDPVSATLTAHTGSVVRWEYTFNNWVTTNTLTTSASTIQISSTTGTSQVRCYIQNEVCPVASSSVAAIVTVAPPVGGAVASSQTLLCTGNNTTTLSLNSYTGSIQNWETAFSVNGPFFIMSNTFGQNNMTIQNVSQTSWYRARIVNGPCPSDISTAKCVSIVTLPSPGFVAGTTSVCAGTNSSTLQLLGYSGSIADWQHSNNNAAWTSLSHTSNILSLQNIQSSGYYRVLVQNAPCPFVHSNSHHITANAVPVVSFQISNGCAGSLFTFTNMSSGSNIYQWDFGNGQGSTIVNPSIQFTRSGTYLITLRGQSSLGCSATSTAQVMVYQSPVANYISADTVCHLGALIFTSNSSAGSGSLTQNEFNFSDGSAAAQATSCVHTFPAHGIYPVKLRVTNNFGCADSVTKPVTVYPKPAAKFSVQNTCAQMQLQLQNNSYIQTGSLRNEWDFSNGYKSILYNPAYSFSVAGQYTLILIELSDHNCSDTAQGAVQIHEKPTIYLESADVCLGLPTPLQFTVNPSFKMKKYAVNFGDGFHSDTLVSHYNYRSSGVFLINVKVTTDSGCTSELSKYLNVLPNPSSAFSANDVCAGDSVKFSFLGAQSSSLGFRWMMDSIQLENKPTVTHYISMQGPKHVILRVRNKFGCADSSEKTLHVFPRPLADFLFSNSCAGTPVSFTNTSTGNITSTRWDFGDNTSETTSAPTKDYVKDGTYSVSLICMSNNGCSDTVTKQVNVYEGPRASFYGRDGCRGDLFKFTNTTQMDSGSYSTVWRIRDTIISEHSPSLVIDSSEILNVTLKVTSTSGCVDSVTKLITVHALPQIYAGRDTLLELGNSIDLSANGGTSYKWYPTEFLSDPLVFDPVCKPAANVEYVVYGTDAYGCENSDTIRIRVKSDFEVIPYNVLTPDGNGLNDTWIIKNIESYPENSVLIFDQWNQVVWQQQTYANNWEGKTMSGELLPESTYYYILTFKGSKRKYTGFIALMRNGIEK